MRATAPACYSCLGGREHGKTQKALQTFALRIFFSFGEACTSLYGYVNRQRYIKYTSRRVVEEKAEYVTRGEELNAQI